MPKKYTQKEFIQKANEKHNNYYDYSLVHYVNSRTNVKIICPIHSVFEQMPAMHLQGQGCKECGLKRSAKKAKYSQTEVIEQMKNVHNNYYDYSLVNYTGTDNKVKIICPVHGIFEQTPYCHIRRKQGCPICAREKKKSVGCQIIENYLNSNNIKFLAEYTFNDCKGVQHKLPFDYYLPEKNILIEYDGEQHFKIKFHQSKKEFEDLKRNDSIKNEYCKEKNITLIRINFRQNDEISRILQEKLNI